MNLTIVDVFAEQPLAGNQLAVVRDCAGLTDTQMQAIAREMNFSETTFVMEETATGARVRIFTPTSELPFAGHPTLGTAWVLCGGEGECRLLLAAGEVPVRFNNGIGWMTPPPVTLGAQFDPQAAAELVGLSPGALDARFPARLAEVGPRFLLVGLEDLGALRSARLNEGLHERYLNEGLGVDCVYLFTRETYGPDADYASRMFFRVGGVREDPATGSANTAFAAYLHDLLGVRQDVIVDQGVEMGRPSRLYLRVGPAPEVGGRVRAVAEGRFAQDLL